LIKDEVEMVGFGAELLEIIENDPNELLQKDQLQSQQSQSDMNQSGIINLDTLKEVKGQDQNK
jgi:hypothetical protein